jgi:hypothetical protein
MTRGAKWMLVLVAASGLLCWPAWAGATSHKPPKHPAVHHTSAAPSRTEQGHVTFWECPAKTTGILVAVNTLTLHPGQSLNIDFIVRNEGTKACNYVAPYAGVAPGPTSSALQAGPCGSIGYEIEDAHHRNIYPGLATYNCPALGFAQMQPNGTAVGEGTWTQMAPPSSNRVAPGRYTLVVGGHFSFPITVAAH